MPETEEGVALVLLILVALVEAAKFHREWLLDTFVDCLLADRMEKVVLKQPYWN